MTNILVNNKHFVQSILLHTNRPWDRKTQADDKATGALGFCPTAEDGFRWCVDRMAAALAYLDQRAAGMTREVAGRLATRLWNGMQAHPSADQLTIVTLENGSTSIHPAASLDLTSGYISGGYVASALVLDVRNLRARILRATEADAAIIGGDDDV